MNFAVIGAGAWGTAFALHAARLGHRATLVPRRAAQAEALLAARENRDYLAGVPLPPELRVTADLTVALAAADVVLLACPAQSLREQLDIHFAFSMSAIAAEVLAKFADSPPGGVNPTAPVS